MKIINLILLAILSFSTAIAQFGPQQIISTNAESAYYVIPADVNSDGFIDVVSLSTENSPIKWYQNLDGLGNFSSEIIIPTSTTGFWSFEVVDLDTDGDNDLLYFEGNPKNLKWRENLDGQGNFGSEQVILTEQSEFIYSNASADIDNDGDLDILLEIGETIGDRIVWHENQDGSGEFGNEISIIDENIAYITPIIVDMDADGVLDLLTAHDEYEPAKIIWFKGLGNGIFQSEQEIYQFDAIISDNTSIIDMKYEDINSDGDKDLIIDTYLEDSGYGFQWLENLDGQGSFGDLVNRNFPNQYYYEIDNDGDNDILHYNFTNNQIYWIENEDGLGNFETTRIISNEVDGPRHVQAADFNGDGLLDVISASQNDDKIAWYENTGILGVLEKNETDLSVHPNPTNGEVLISSEVDIATIAVFDNLGRKIKSLQNAKNISLEEMQPGIYFVKIASVEGASETLKVVRM